MRVLIAVFDSGIRELLERHIDGRGHEPVCTPDPEAAVEMHRENPFPLLLVEVRGGDVDLVHRMREVEASSWSYLLAVLPASRRASDGSSKEPRSEGSASGRWLAAGADDGLILPGGETERETGPGAAAMNGAAIDAAAVDATELDLRLEVALHRLERRRAAGWGGERLRLTQFTVDHAADGVFWIGRNARFLYVNDTVCEKLGYTHEELLGMTVHDIDPDFPRELWEESWLEVKQGGVFTRESRHRRKNGEVFPVELRVHCVQWEDHEVHVAVARDISERKRAEEMLRFNAFHDALTGLPNRSLFMDRLQHCMDRSRRSETRFAVLFLDLDRFKVVNDSLGHVVGDELLARIASRLRASLRAVDTVARVGGDEFLVLVEDIDSDNAAIKVAERIQTDLQRVFHVQDHEIFTSVSVGIAFGGDLDRYHQAVEILRDADIAMYRSKAQGGGRATIFHPEMHRRAVSRLELETDLRRALQRDQLHLAYQPIVEVATGRVRAFEALLRWRHPRRGELAPAAFLQAAEETGLIVPLTWWVLETACRQASSLAEVTAPREGPVTDGSGSEDFATTDGAGSAVVPLSVNLSSRLIGHPELVERLTRTLDEHGVEPVGIGLEITESVILDHPGSAGEVLEELSARGFRIAIDDFGAGYSSLRYLSRLPVTRVKIDRSFVRRLTEEPKSREITRSVVSLVHNLGMEAVAEGVETPAQLEMLRAMGCDLVQGFLLGRPERGCRILDRLRDEHQPGASEESAGPPSQPSVS